MLRLVFLLDKTTATTPMALVDVDHARSTSSGGGCRNPTAEYHTCFHLWMLYC
jgi:hypothetical protein